MFKTIMEVYLENNESTKNLNQNQLPRIIIDKKKLKIIKNEKNNYDILYNLKNHNIYLSQIINFDLIKLIYEINKDVFEDFNIEIINENEANIYLLLKHYFKELGFPKRYLYLNLQKEKKENNIQFKFKTIYDDLPNINNFPSDVIILPIDTMNVNYDFISDHNLKANHNIIFLSTFEIPDFIEKITLTIFSNMFLRTKQFIENIKL
jgi:hypothetical protein